MANRAVYSVVFSDPPALLSVEKEIKHGWRGGAAVA